MLRRTSSHELPHGGDSMTPDGNGAAEPAPAPTPKATAKPHELHPTQPRRGNRPLPTDRIAFAKQLDLLRAYDAASGIERKPVSLTVVGQIAGVTAATASLANGFFVDVKLIQKVESTKQFIPSQAVHEFALAHEWDRKLSAAKLGPVLRESWAYVALLPALRYSPSITQNEAVRLLAEACGATPDYRTQLLLVLQYLEAAGLLFRDGQNLRRGEITVTVDPGGSGEVAPVLAPEKPVSASRVGGGSGSGGRPEGAIRFAVSVNIDLAEMRGWSPDRIAKLFEGISKVIAAKGGDPEMDEESQ